MPIDQGILLPSKPGLNLPYTLYDGTPTGTSFNKDRGTIDVLINNNKLIQISISSNQRRTDSNHEVYVPDTTAEIYQLNAIVQGAARAGINCHFLTQQGMTGEEFVGLTNGAYAYLSFKGIIEHEEFMEKLKEIRSYAKTKS